MANPMVLLNLTVSFVSLSLAQAENFRHVLGWLTATTRRDEFFSMKVSAQNSRGGGGWECSCWFTSILRP